MPLNFRKENPATRSYGLVIVLLIISLVCLLAYSLEGAKGPMHTIQRGTSALFTPLKLASGEFATMQYSAFTAIQDATGNESSLQELQRQNEQLRQTVAQLEEYRQESERLQDLLDFQDMYSLEGVTATVVSRSGDSWNNNITIGKGSDDGIRAGLPVVGSAGLVGQVVSVAPHTATVRLLQDSKSGVAVVIQSSRVEGIVKGSLDGLLYLQNIPDDADVKEGDVVVTSGLGGSFNRGLIVGTVVKVEGEKGSPSRRIIIDPNETAGPLQEVMVITGMGSEGALEEKSEDEDSAEAEGEEAAPSEEYVG